MSQRAAPEILRPKSEGASILDEELLLLATVQKQLAAEQLKKNENVAYDDSLLSLRDQIYEARAEDVAPLVAEMYRLQALGAAGGKSKELPVDVKCPYFGHLKLSSGSKTSRDVLIGNRGFVKAGVKVAIVDWRNAPVSRIYYTYEEGDDYEENFGGKYVQGLVEARRTLSIVEGVLRRVTWSEGSVAKRGDGEWVYFPAEARPTLSGGAGIASRPPPPAEFPSRHTRGQLGVVGDESLREDKHLKEITALIDPQQFKMITQPESGTIILQGGAGSGKTTVALHRAAYLHFQDPNTFSPKKMAIVVKSAPLTEYISRVLPSLDVSGTQVVTLANWMKRTRKKVWPEYKQKYTDDVPDSVSKLKKHPAILRMLELGVEQEAEVIADELDRNTNEAARKKVGVQWTDYAHLALLPRIRRMVEWVEGAGSVRADLDGKSKRNLLGVLRRARSEGGDVAAAWADFLSDRTLISRALEEKNAQNVSSSEIKELIEWVGIQSDEQEPEDENGESDSNEERTLAVDAGGAPRHVRDGKKDIPHLSQNTGADGRAIEDDDARGKFDEHDDALLLKLTQLKYGGLPIAGSKRSVLYEHIVVDEAQDLSPTDVAVIRGALSKRESMTLAGDTAQKLIFDNGFETWEGMLEDVGIKGVKIDQLKISYRSTQEIVQFSRHILGPLADPEAPVVPRTGAPVEMFPFGSTGEAIAFLGESLRSLVTRERKANIAVVARFGAQADIYYNGLKRAEVPSLRRVHGKDFSFSPGVDVVDVSQVKGLEYDYVIMVEVNESSYGPVREARHLLHIASTRAVHQLWVTSVGKPSPLLPSL